MTVLAILQNTWAKEPERVTALFKKFHSTRHLICARLLFMGSNTTGRRIRKTFGDFAMNNFIWEESTPVVTGTASASPPADEQHVAEIITKHAPNVILAFGKTAFNAVKRSHWRGLTIEAPHPAARQPDTLTKLHAAAVHLEAFLKAQP